MLSNNNKWIVYEMQIDTWWSNKHAKSTSKLIKVQKLKSYYIKKNLKIIITTHFIDYVYKDIF